MTLAPKGLEAPAFFRVSARSQSQSCASGQGLAAATFFVESEIGGSPGVCKRLSSRARGDQEAVRGMREEGALLAALGGRGTPRLLARGDDAHGPYLVMERIAMATLAAKQTQGTADPAWLARAARAVFARLAEVHDAADSRGALSVVHADLSPDNVVIADDGRDAKILDLGLAQWRDGTRRDAGPFRGTLLYAAPELARGEAIDTRADLFALAASLLHAAGGLPPRAAPLGATARSAGATAQTRPVQNAPRLLLLAAEAPIDAWAAGAAAHLPEPVARALTRCIAFLRDDRPRSAADVAGSF